MRRKILQVVNIPFVLPYYFGDQIEFLRDHNYEVTIACSPGPDLVKFCEKYGIRGVGIDILRKIDVFADIKALIKLYSLIRREKFDFVIGHTPKGALLSMLAAKLAGVENRIYMRHGIVYQTSKGLRKYMMIMLEKLTSICATRIVSVSRSVEDYAIKSNLNPKGKSIIFNKGTCNGLDVNRFTKANSDNLRCNLGLEGCFVVGYVGRLVNDKGIGELIEAWSLIKSTVPNAKLLLVGPFEERDSLPDHTKKAILEDSTIKYIGLVDDTVEFYNAMDVFILPSYREGFPTVVLEASAMQLPIITTKSTGCVDSIVEHRTGVFTAIDSESIAEQILFYYKNPDIRTEHGENGRKWVIDNFDQKVVWHCILTEILQ